MTEIDTLIGTFELGCQWAPLADGVLEGTVMDMMAGPTTKVGCVVTAKGYCRIDDGFLEAVNDPDPARLNTVPGLYCPRHPAGVA